MKRNFVGSFAVICLVMATFFIGACDKPPCITCPSPVEKVPTPREHAIATVSDNVVVRCENGTTVTVSVTGYGEAYAATYEEAKKIADQKAQADLETAKAGAQVNVMVVCRSTPAPTPPPVPPPTPPPPIPVPPQPAPTPTCTFADVPKIRFDYQGGSNGGFFIGTQSGCRWSVESKDFWITIPADRLFGVGQTNNIPVFAAGNGPSSRTGHIDLKDGSGKLIQSIVVEQGARPF